MLIKLKYFFDNVDKKLETSKITGREEKYNNKIHNYIRYYFKNFEEFNKCVKSLENKSQIELGGTVLDGLLKITPKGIERLESEKGQTS